MIEVYPLTITQAEFKTAPERERLFYLKLGVIANEVSALNKLSLFSLNQSDDRMVTKRASSALAMLWLRLLAGRLYEAHDVITTGYNPLKLAYRSDMKREGGTISYRKLNAYFVDPNNLVKAVRHKLAFHTDDTVFKTGEQMMDFDEDIVDYMCQQRGNTLFWGGEAALVYAVRHLAGDSDAETTFSKLLGETSSVAGHVNNFAYAFGLSFFHRNFPEKLVAMESEKIEITDAVDLAEFSLPWFFEPPSET
jgi:hypothetical protein